jgi:hypothetical protein
MATALEDNSQQPKKLYIPDTMSRWPWRRLVNPHEKEVDVESKAWLRTFPPPIAISRWEATIENSRSGA